MSRTSDSAVNVSDAVSQLTEPRDSRELALATQHCNLEAERPGPLSHAPYGMGKKGVCQGSNCSPQPGNELGNQGKYSQCPFRRPLTYILDRQAG